MEGYWDRLGEGRRWVGELKGRICMVVRVYIWNKWKSLKGEKDYASLVLVGKPSGRYCVKFESYVRVVGS